MGNNDYLKVAKECVRLANEIKSIKNRRPPYLAGLAGEFLVMQKLHDRGLKPKPMGAQSGYDIQLEDGKRVEVRTSQSKREGVQAREKDVVDWGWRLKNRGKENKFDYVVCVALDERNIEDSECYMLSADEVDRAPSTTLPRFKKVEKKLWIYRSREAMDDIRRKNPQYLSDWEIEINQNRSKYLLDNRLGDLVR